MIMKLRSREMQEDPHRSIWPVSLFAAGLALIFWVYRGTVWAMVAIWSDSSTFGHGFFIFPISAFLIWKKRTEILTLKPVPDLRPLFLLFLVGFLWTLGFVASIQVVQQYSVVLMIPLLVWSVFGWKITQVLLFPLGFLLFAVPFGEFLIPGLIRFTADFTVFMVQLSGIPIYRDGNFFSLPTGDWSVIKACSGIRYLIASITLGCLYAYLSYRSLWRRLAFLVLAAIFPVIANGFRAYLIVMTGHFSEMKYAVGADHLVYGWVFFGLIMLLMFQIGNLWKERPESGSVQPARVPCPEVYVPQSKYLLTTVLLMFVIVFWPLWADRSGEPGSDPGTEFHVSLPEKIGSWRIVSAVTSDWIPHYAGYTDKQKIVYDAPPDHPVAVYFFYYGGLAQGRELVNSENAIVDPGDISAKLISMDRRRVSLNGGISDIRQSRIEIDRRFYLVWEFNWIDKVFTSSPAYSKFLEIRQTLLGRHAGGVAIVLCTQYVDRADGAEQRLQQFAKKILPVIDTTLYASVSKDK